MHHGHRSPIRGHHHIYILMDRHKRSIQHIHGKGRGAYGDIASAGPHRIGGHHACACVTLRGRAGGSRLQGTRGVQQLCSLRGDMACLHACRLHLRQQLRQTPIKTADLRQLLELQDHFRIIAPGGNINGEHARGIAYPQDLLPRELPVHIACQGSKEGNLRHLRLPVQDSLIEVGNAPALGNIEAKQRPELPCRLPGDVVPPGAELGQLLTFLVKGQIAMHHGADAEAAKLRQLHAVLLFHLCRQATVTGLDSLPDLIQRICPNTIYQLIFPAKAALSQDFGLPVHQHRLDIGRSQLQPQGGFPCRQSTFYLLACQTNHPSAVCPLYVNEHILS